MYLILVNNDYIFMAKHLVHLIINVENSVTKLMNGAKYRQYRYI